MQKPNGQMLGGQTKRSPHITVSHFRESDVNLHWLETLAVTNPTFYVTLGSDLEDEGNDPLFSLIKSR